MGFVGVKGGVANVCFANQKEFTKLKFFGKSIDIFKTNKIMKTYPKLFSKTRAWQF